MHGHETLEAVAAFVLVGFGAVFLAASWWARRHAPSSGPRPGEASTPEAPPPASIRATERTLALIAASFLLGASLIHFAVVEDHMAVEPLFGQAFAALGVWQLLLAGLVLSGTAWARSLVAFSMLMVIVVWAASRSVGLPLGTHPWVAEPMGTADIVATTLEVGAVAIIAIGFDAHMRIRRAVGLQHDAMAVAAVPAIGLAGVATLIALASILAGATHGHA